MNNGPLMVCLWKERWYWNKNADSDYQLEVDGKVFLEDLTLKHQETLFSSSNTHYTGTSTEYKAGGISAFREICTNDKKYVDKVDDGGEKLLMGISNYNHMH